MKFMAKWKIHEDKWLPILAKWVSRTPRQHAEAVPGVKIIGRWHDFAARSDVIDDEEATAVAKQALADIKLA